jgi:hypothetical protein
VQSNTAQQKAQKQAEAISGVASLIKPVSELALSEPSRFCFYGEPKKGKTTLAASSGLRTLIIEADPGGLEPLAGKPGVDAIRLERWEQMDGLFWFLHAGDHQYEVVVWDTATMMQTMLLRMVMDNETRLDSLTPATPHHQKVARILNNEILRWTLLPYHLVFLAQQRNITIKKEELGGEELLQHVVPYLSPSPLGTLLAAVGTVGRVYTREVQDPENPNKIKIQHRLLLAPNDTFYAGTRIRRLPKIMADPTLEKILQIRAISGEASVGDEDDGLQILTQDLLDEEYAARVAAQEPGVTDDAATSDDVLPIL